MHVCMGAVMTEGKGGSDLVRLSVGTVASSGRGSVHGSGMTKAGAGPPGMVTAGCGKTGSGVPTLRGEAGAGVG